LLDEKILDICCRSTNISLLWLAFFVTIPKEKNMQTIIVGTIVLIAFFFCFVISTKRLRPNRGRDVDVPDAVDVPPSKRVRPNVFRIRENNGQKISRKMIEGGLDFMTEGGNEVDRHFLHT
jgi:hypothetical protein